MQEGAKRIERPAGNSESLDNNENVSELIHIQRAGGR